MIHQFKKRLKGTLRRTKDALLPGAEVRAYRQSLAGRLAARQSRYPHEPEPGLFSILTAVWNGSPLSYLRTLATSIERQNASGATEWVLLDNGCSRPELLAYLQELGAKPWIRLLHAEANLGILRGLRRCLEAAHGRYVLPVDGDDLIDNDCLRVIASALHQAAYPPLLYTDEDKLLGARRYQPYFKPDWDPVLLLNSAYTAHLGVIDREKALTLGAYSDPATEGSPDWDLFVRFLIAGYQAAHLPEVVYSWRVHSASTADDDATKDYIVRSQRAVLQRFLDSRPAGRLFTLEPSPLFTGGAHWHFRRHAGGEERIVLIRGNDPEARRRTAQTNEFVTLLDDRVELRGDEWRREALGIFELHPDTIAVCGRMLDDHPGDPGYFGQLWKQRTIRSISPQLAIVRSAYLLGDAPPAQHRIVYTPFIEGLCRGA